MDKIEKCVGCGNDTFVDQPAGYVSNRWKGKEDFPATRCTKCGVTYFQESIDESQRTKEG